MSCEQKYFRLEKGRHGLESEAHRQKKEWAVTDMIILERFDIFFRQQKKMIYEIYSNIPSRNPDSAANLMLVLRPASPMNELVRRGGRRGM